MELHLDLIDTKIEFFEADTQKTLEDQIRYAIDKNKALMLDVHSVHYQTAFNHRTEKMHYSAAVHFKLKR